MRRTKSILADTANPAHTHVQRTIHVAKMHRCRIPASRATMKSLSHTCKLYVMHSRCDLIRLAVWWRNGVIQLVILHGSHIGKGSTRCPQMRTQALNHAL